MEELRYLARGHRQILGELVGKLTRRIMELLQRSFPKPVCVVPIVILSVQNQQPVR